MGDKRRHFQLWEESDGGAHWKMDPLLFSSPFGVAVLRSTTMAEAETSQGIPNFLACSLASTVHDHFSFRRGCLRASHQQRPTSRDRNRPTSSGRAPVQRLPTETCGTPAKMTLSSGASLDTSARFFALFFQQLKFSSF
jgi:hypothetical protein